jgi:hypothetical protein
VNSRGDTFVEVDGTWLIVERNLYVDWIETRTSHPQRYRRTAGA